MIEVAGTAAAKRLRLSVFARVYAVSAVVLSLAVCYLVVAAQATQNAYDLSHLKDRRAQLQAEQGQLQYQSATLHGPARIQQEAAATALQRPTNPTYVAAQPVAVELDKPIGPNRPDSSPLWKRAMAAVFGGHDVFAAEP